LCLREVEKEEQVKQKEVDEKKQSKQEQKSRPGSLKRVNTIISLYPG
jgi:hypothetical protein